MCAMLAIHNESSICFQLLCPTEIMEVLYRAYTHDQCFKKRYDNSTNRTSQPFARYILYQS